MQSWLNSLILKGSGFSFKSVSVREQVFQSYNDLCCAQCAAAARRPVAATWLRSCYGRRRVLSHTSDRGRLEGLDEGRWTSLASRSAACLSAMKET